MPRRESTCWPKSNGAHNRPYPQAFELVRIFHLSEVGRTVVYNSTTGPADAYVAQYVCLKYNSGIRWAKQEEAGNAELTWTCRNVSCATKCSERNRGCMTGLYKGSDNLMWNVGCSTTYGADCNYPFICLCY